MEALFITALAITGALSFWVGRLSVTPNDKPKSEYAEIVEAKYKTPEGLMEGVRRR